MKNEQRYALTIDEILEMINCAMDCQLNEFELGNYVRAFLFEVEQKRVQNESQS